MPQLYDKIGGSYGQTRVTDPLIAEPVWRELGDAQTVLNVGAGTGSYEPPDRHVVAVEPSATMREQRRAGAAKCIAASAESLPFPDASFDAAMSIASHWHWPDEARGFAEMRRVARDRIVVLTVDRARADDFWLTAEYLPTAHALWRPVEETAAMIGVCEVVVIPISAGCADGFYQAFWRRPHAYLDDSIRKTMAVFARLDPIERNLGLERLRADLDAGRWRERHADLLKRDEIDLGLRLLVHLKGSERSRGSLAPETP